MSSGAWYVLIPIIRTSVISIAVHPLLLAGEHLALGPDGDHDHRVAERNDERRNEEERQRHQHQVHLPLPREIKVDPALQLT